MRCKMSKLFFLVSLDGATDSDLFDEAQVNNAVFITTDKDFFHTIPNFYKRHSGIIVIALSQPNGSQILDKLTWALNHFEEPYLRSRVIMLTDKRYHIYSCP